MGSLVFLHHIPAHLEHVGPYNCLEAADGGVEHAHQEDGDTRSVQVYTRHLVEVVVVEEVVVLVGEGMEDPHTCSKARAGRYVTMAM